MTLWALYFFVAAPLLALALTFLTIPREDR